MKKNKKILFFFASYFSIITFSAIAMSPIPYQFEREKKHYIAKQISHDNKLFLKKLSKAFEYFADINKETLKIIKATFPKGTKNPKKILKHISYFTNSAINAIEGKKGFFTNDKKFIGYFFTHEIELKKELDQLRKKYKRIKNIDLILGSDPKSKTYAEGAYHYYQLRIKYIVSSKEKSPVQDNVAKSINLFNKFSNLDLQYHLKNTKKELKNYSQELKEIITIIENDIIEPMKVSNSTWATKLIIEIMSLSVQQLKLNLEFSKSTLERLDKISDPKEANTPDLKVTSIEFKLPENPGLNSIITITAEIKNIGDIKSFGSKALIVLPSGTKNARSVPKLEAGTTYTLKWKYKLRKKGRNKFIIKANYKYLPWEANTSNNITSRTLIVN